MSEDAATLTPPDFVTATRQMRDAASAKKCWQCGCLHSSLRAIGEAFPEGGSAELGSVLALARSRLQPTRYDCLGCEICWPALAINALGVEGDACPAEPAKMREGWPALPGSYQTSRYHAPVAVCTLTDETLMNHVAANGAGDVAIVGTLQTENLGIERLIQNTLANPNIRFLVLCGMDSRQAIGHLPGQSLLALARSGVDDRMRIVGAPGKRPLLRNLSREAVEHFRRSVEVVNLIGEVEVPRIVEAAKTCAEKNPGPAEPFGGTRPVNVVAGYLPARMVSDPAGYFVVYPDRKRGLLQLEHYRNDGVLDAVVEGRSPAELYVPAIEKKLISRLDHSAYLGRELARAEQALLTGGPFVQDAAPEVEKEGSAKQSSCACGDSCKEGGPGSAQEMSVEPATQRPDCGCDGPCEENKL